MAEPIPSKPYVLAPEAWLANPELVAVADDSDEDNGFYTDPSKKKKPTTPSSTTQPISGTATQSDDGYLANRPFWFIVDTSYTGVAAALPVWRALDYVGNIGEGETQPPMAMGIFPLGPVSLPLPPLPAYHLTAKQQLLLASITAGAGVVDIATDLAVAKSPNSYTPFSGFTVSMFGPTLDAMADAQHTRQLLAYTTLVGNSPSDKPARVIFAGYYILRQLTDAALTQPNPVNDSPLLYWNDLTGQAASQSPDAIDDCEWKGICKKGKEVRMLDTPFAVADHVNNGMRGVDTFLAATGAHGMLMVDGKPSGGNFAAGVAVPMVSVFLRHDEEQAWDFTGQDGTYLLRDFALQGGGLLLAWATQDDPETQFRLTSVISTLLMAVETPRALEVLYKTEDAGVYDDQFSLGGNVFYGYQNAAAGIASANALFDKDKSWAARLTPGLIAVAGVTATTLYMNHLGVKAREPQYRDDSMGFLGTMDPKVVGVAAFIGAPIVVLGGSYGIKALAHLIAPNAVDHPTSLVAGGEPEAWNGQPTGLKFDLAPAMLPAATGGSTPGLQAGLSFQF